MSNYSPSSSHLKNSKKSPKTKSPQNLQEPKTPQNPLAFNNPKPSNSKHPTSLLRLLRLLRLGDLNSNPPLLQNLHLAWQRSLPIIDQELHLTEPLDCIFFQQTHINDSDGATFYRFPNFIQIRLQTSPPLPTPDAIAATIVQSITMHYIDRHSWLNHRQPELLFDLYRCGVGLKLANQLPVNWHLDTLTPDFLARHKSLIHSILQGIHPYDPDYWFDETGTHPYFLAWFIGEAILNQIITTSHRPWQQITCQDFLTWLSSP